MQLIAKRYLKYQFKFLIPYLVQHISYYFTNTTSNKKKYLQQILSHQLFSTPLA